MTDSEIAKKIIETNIYMVLSTASLEGEPWISPVFFAYDHQYNLYWVSNKDANHSELIRKNPRVAISIFNSQAPEGDGDGVYVKADVTELADEVEIKNGMETFNNRASMDDFKIKNISEVTGNGIWRIYKAKPNEITKLGKGTFVNGQYIDQRIPVDLKN